MYFKFIFLCLFLAKNSFYVASTALVIVDTTPEEFPYVASIEATFMCPAALITENYLLTIGECVQNSSYVNVNLGFSRQPMFYTKEQNTQTYTTSYIFIHEDFANRKIANHYLNNIALIKLKEPVILTDKVRPGKLISIEPNIPNEVHVAKVTGWYYDLNTVMQAETVELLNQTKCNSRFGSSFSKNQELCTMSGSTQNLDIIGNVLTVNKKIAGFMVKRYDCPGITSSKCLKTHIFLNIAPFLHWISQNVGVPVAKLTANHADMMNLDKINCEKLENIFGQIDNTNKKLKIDNKLEEKIDKLLKQEEYISTLNNEIREIKTTTSNVKNKNRQNYDELKENIQTVGKELNEFLNEQKYDHIKIDARYNDIIPKVNNLSNEISTLNKNVNKLLDIIGAPPEIN